MTAPSRRALVLGLFLLALVFHLSIVWQDFSVLAKNGFLYDDSFYAFKIAQNIAHGSGVTFDGVHPTNGFQPLYVFMLVPVFWLAGSSLTAPVYVALSLCALMTALTAVILFKLLNRYVGERTALMVASLWAFSPVVTRQTANGLETSLALLMFASLVYYYLSRVRPNRNPTRGNFVTMGLLVGLAVLARVDQVFVALAIVLDYLLVMRRRHEAGTALRGVGMGLVSCVAVYSPWLLFSYLQVGSFVQDSGAATRFLSIAYAPFFNLGSSEMIDQGPSLAFVWGHVMKAFAVLKIAPPVHVLFRGVEKLGTTVGLPGLFGIVASVAGFGLIAMMVVVARRHRDDPDMRRISELGFLLVAAVSLMAAYAFYVFGVFFFIRYLYPIYFIACIIAAFYLQLLFKRVDACRYRARACAFVGLAVYLGAFAYMSYTSAFRSQATYYFYDVARWIDENTSRDDTIGVFQGGAIGYLSDRKVINLDGKVNGEALDALRHKRIDAYLEENGVNVVLDNSHVLTLFLGARENPDVLKHAGYTKIMHGAKDGVPGWSAYRIEPTAVGQPTTGYGASNASSGLH